MVKEMSRREFVKVSAATGALLMAGSLPLVSAQEFKAIQLPKPQIEGGKPLMQCLKDRKSEREFSDQKIPLQVLSNLLWAGCGINRPETGGWRTAPTGGNVQNVDVYVAIEEGTFVYDAKGNMLAPVLAEDIRKFSGRQATSKLDDSPLNLIYVVDLSKFTRGPEMFVAYAFAHAAFIIENVYLFCASEGLATVARISYDKATVVQKLKLKVNQYATFVQSVGYPKK
jgi:hypothetical protein